MYIKWARAVRMQVYIVVMIVVYAAFFVASALIAREYAGAFNIAPVLMVMTCSLFIYCLIMLFGRVRGFLIRAATIIWPVITAACVAAFVLSMPHYTARDAMEELAADYPESSIVEDALCEIEGCKNPMQRYGYSFLRTNEKGFEFLILYDPYAGDYDQYPLSNMYWDGEDEEGGATES